MPGFGLSSYEVVPYTSQPLIEAHPDTLATIATLFGMKPPLVSRARVLDIGCGLGANVIAMATELPEGRFLGIENSERQVAEGRATIEAAGLGNVELRRMDLGDAGPGLGTFDYILCHGVFSWVGPEVRQKILFLIAATLASDGVAFVSYNTYPGWHLRSIVRDAMLFHIDGDSEPREGIRKGREVLDFLVQRASGPDNSYPALVRDLGAKVLQNEGSYLLHDYLEEVNQPFYYHQFLEQAATVGLKGVADAEFSSMACVASEPIRQALGRISDDPARQEEYLDFLRGRMFRCTLLCQQRVELLPGPSVAAVEGLQAALRVQPGSLTPGFSAGAIDAFRNWRDQVVTVEHPVLKAGALVLGERWPRAISFRDLWRAATARLLDARLTASDYGAPERRRLAAFLLQGYGAGWLELHSYMAPFVREPGARPATTPLARHQALSGGRVTNLRHEPGDLPRFDRHLVGLLDGQRTHSELVDALDALVTAGTLTIRGSDRGPLDPASRRAIVAESLRQGLSRLAACALLVS